LSFTTTFRIHRCLPMHPMQRKDICRQIRFAAHHGADEINALIVKKGTSGKIVVRLKGGTLRIRPRRRGMRGAACRRHFVRGSSRRHLGHSCTGICWNPCYPSHNGFVGRVYHRQRGSTETSTAIHWEYLAKGVDTLVFYMGVGNLPAITTELIKQGKPQRLLLPWSGGGPNRHKRR